SVVFKFFTTIDCTGPSSDETVSSVTEITPPTSSTAGVAPAESATQNQPAGFYSYKATFTPAANTPYSGDAVATCEPLTVLIRNSSVNTVMHKDTASGASVLNTAIDASGSGTTVVDVATITGTVGGPDPTGTVTFTRYATANCSGTGTAEQVTIVADGDPTDHSTTVNAAPRTFNSINAAAGAFLCYVTSYSGDANYQGSTA